MGRKSDDEVAPVLGQRTEARFEQGAAYGIEDSVDTRGIMGLKLCAPVRVAIVEHQIGP